MPSTDHIRSDFTTKSYLWKVIPWELFWTPTQFEQFHAAQYTRHIPLSDSRQNASANMAAA